MADQPRTNSNLSDPSNPFASPEDGLPSPIKAPADETVLSVVSDTVTGVNLRASDNWFQMKCIIATMVVLAALGGILAALIRSWQLHWLGGVLIGGFLGVLVGLLGSGVFLMFYRAIYHLKGKQD